MKISDGLIPDHPLFVAKDFCEVEKFAYTQTVLLLLREQKSCCTVMRKPLHVCIASDGALADAPKEMFAYIKGKVLIASRYKLSDLHFESNGIIFSITRR